MGRLDRGEIRGPLIGRLDTDRAAVTGHSAGGAAALLAARREARFVAVINIDGAPAIPTRGRSTSRYWRSPTPSTQR